MKIHPKSKEGVLLWIVVYLVEGMARSTHKPTSNQGKRIRRDLCSFDLYDKKLARRIGKK